MVLQELVPEIGEAPQPADFLKYVGKPEIDMLEAYCCERGLRLDVKAANSLFYSTYTKEAERMKGELACPGASFCPYSVLVVFDQLLFCQARSDASSQENGFFNVTGLETQCS